LADHARCGDRTTTELVEVSWANVAASSLRSRGAGARVKSFGAEAKTVTQLEYCNTKENSTYVLKIPA
jgi:hypothetical protein